MNALEKLLRVFSPDADHRVKLAYALGYLDADNGLDSQLPDDDPIFFEAARIANDEYARNTATNVQSSGTT